MSLLRRAGDDLILFAVALGVRVVYFLPHTKSIYFNRPILDSLWIHQWASALATGTAADSDAFFRAPLYPYFVALVYRLFGAGAWIMEPIQHLMGAVSVVLLYRLGRLLFDRRTGFLAGLFLAFYWLAVYFEGELLIVSLLVLLTVAFLYLFVKATEASEPSGRALSWLAGGLLLGLACAARPNFLFFAPIATIWPLVTRRCRASFVSCALVAAGIIIPIAPITLRNINVADDLVLISSQGGLNFFIGNGPGADGKTATAPASMGPMTRDDVAARYRDNVTLAGRQVAEEAEGRRLKASEVSRYWFSRSWRSIADAPAEAAFRLLRKIYYFCNGFEISNNKDLREVLSETPWIRVAMVNLLWVLPLAWVGLAGGIGRHLGRLLIVSFMLIYLISVILFFVNARFRLPVIPIAFLFASSGAWRLKDVVSRGVGTSLDPEIREGRPLGISRVAPRGTSRSREAIGLSLVLVVGILVSNSRLFGIDERRGLSGHHVNRAVVLVEAGRCDEAIKAYDDAVSLAPEMIEATYGRARALERCGRIDEAILAYRDLAEERPDFAFCQLALGRLLSEGGRIDEADAAYSKAIAIEPELADAHLNYAGFLMKTGAYERAAPAFERGLELDSARLIGWINYGYTLAALGRLADAISAWERVLALDPRNETARSNIERARTMLENP